MAKFVVAVKRGRKGSGLAAKVAVEMPELTLLGGDNPDRVVVEASAKSIDKARSEFGTDLIFEPLIEHKLAGR